MGAGPPRRPVLGPAARCRVVPHLRAGRPRPGRRRSRSGTWCASGSRSVAGFVPQVGLPIRPLPASRTCILHGRNGGICARYPQEAIAMIRAAAEPDVAFFPPTVYCAPVTGLAAPEARIGTRRGGATRRPSRCAPWVRGQATGTCPRGRPVRAHRWNRCGRRRRPRARMRSWPGLSRVYVATSVPVMAAISATGPWPPRNCHSRTVFPASGSRAAASLR